MAFLLSNVVPWGRRLSEYQEMFHLDNEEIKRKKIVSFGDGPASFNAEASKKGANILSLDPIYKFSKQEIQMRIKETRDIILEQARINKDNYLWDKIKSLEELEQIRMTAMQIFLEDYETGLMEGRYQYYELPNNLNFDNDSFDLGLSSHFLLLYTSLGLDFHVKSINEMLRVCKEVRIFPILDLDSKESELTKQVIDYFKDQYVVQVQKVNYEFQKGGNKMLTIQKFK